MRAEVVEAYRAGRVRVEHLPQVQCLEPTDGCNFACSSCPRPEGAPTYLDLDALERWVERDGDAFRTEAVWLHFSGESLLHPRFFDIAALLADRGIRTRLSTNASLLNPRRRAALLASGIEAVVFSIDAARRATYEQVRIGGDFDAVRANVRAFLAERGAGPRPRTQVQMVLGSQPPEEVLEFVAWWRATPIDEIGLKRYSTRTGLLPLPGRARTGPAATGGGCVDPWLNVVVRSNGEVLPCCSDFAGALVLGDLNEQSLEEVWNGEPLQRLRAAHASGTGLPDACRRCSDLRTPDDTDPPLTFAELPGSLPALRDLLVGGRRHLVFRR